jgi:Fe-Mn family superoxide dismutase
MAFKLLPLPYATNALEPHLSRRAMEYHHGRHHATYVETLNRLIEETPYAGLLLEEIIQLSAARPDDQAIFNNASQAWNHDEFWNSMQPGGGKTGSEIDGLLTEQYGSYARFRQEFVGAATGQFGSGWTWLVLDGEKLAVISTPNAANPLTMGKVPLLACDVWEHAYYLDYQNRRKAFVEAFLDHLVNWERVASRLREAEILPPVAGRKAIRRAA